MNTYRLTKLLKGSLAVSDPEEWEVYRISLYNPIHYEHERWFSVLVITYEASTNNNQ